MRFKGVCFRGWGLSLTTKNSSPPDPQDLAICPNRDEQEDTAGNKINQSSRTKGAAIRTDRHVRHTAGAHEQALRFPPAPQLCPAALISAVNHHLALAAFSPPLSSPSAIDSDQKSPRTEINHDTKMSVRTSSSSLVRFVLSFATNEKPPSSRRLDMAIKTSRAHAAPTFFPENFATYVNQEPPPPKNKIKPRSKLHERKN